jgi:hypothetical protein
MAIVINGILCDEIVTALDESVDFKDGPAARKGYICNWADRWAVAKGLLGFNRTTTILGRITVNLPHPYPDFPYMYAHTIDIEPKGSPIQGTGSSQWVKAIVWANYKCTPWTFGGIDGSDPGQQNQFPSSGGYIYAEQQMNSSAEWATVPGVAGQFKTSGKLVGQDIGIRLCLIDCIITFHRVPYLPAAQAYQLAGFANSSSFLGVDTGKLLFNGYQTHQTRNTDGTVTTDITANYQGRSQRWDYGFDPSGPRWDQIVWPDGTTPFIGLADLSQTIPGGYG